MITIDRLVFSERWEGVSPAVLRQSVSVVAKKGDVSMRVTRDMADFETDTRTNLEQLLIDMRIEVEKAWNESE